MLITFEQVPIALPVAGIGKWNRQLVTATAASEAPAAA